MCSIKAECDATDIQAEVASKQANMNYNRQMSYSFRGKML